MYDKSEVLGGLVSILKWSRNKAKFLASTSENMDQKSRPVVKMVKKRSKLLISSSKGPRKRGKSVGSSSPRLLKNNTQGLVLEHSDVGSFNKKGMCSISNVQAK